MFTERLQKIQNKYREDKAAKDHLLKTVDSETRNLKTLEKDYIVAEKGLALIQIIAQETQKNLEFHLSDPVTTALMAVSSEFPEFKASIEIKRKKTECNLYFVENEIEANPMECSGGGALDVASFALRIGYWSLKKNRPTFLLDEPFRDVSPDLQSKVSEMIKMISERLEVQIVMISHAEQVNYAADKTFIVEKRDNRSYVRVEK